MITADSSFLVEGLLKRKDLLEKEVIVTADFAVSEVVNAVWKHQFLIKDLKDGRPYVSIFYGLINSGRIRLVQLDEESMLKAYSLAGRNATSVYDASFVTLAIETGSELRTLDVRQAEILKKELGR